jgi:hypothetical protein
MCNAHQVFFAGNAADTVTMGIPRQDLKKACESNGAFF